MSTVEYNFELGGFNAPQPAYMPPAQTGGAQPLHRIAQVRQEQGISVRSVARRLGISMQDARAQEQPYCDLRMSQLHEWQRVLEVPLADLLLDSSSALSTPVSQRARMLRVMKTAKALVESAREPSASRLATMLVSQLVELMPELAEVSAWHTVGQRRTQDEMGRIVERSLPDSFFGEPGY